MFNRRRLTRPEGANLLHDGPDHRKIGQEIQLQLVAKSIAALVASIREILGGLARRTFSLGLDHAPLDDVLDCQGNKHDDRWRPAQVLLEEVEHQDAATAFKDRDENRGGVRR